MRQKKILEIESLQVNLPTSVGWVQAVSGLNLTIHQRECWCLVGESGCGKTMVAMSIMRLLPSNAHISGRAIFKGQNLLTFSENAIRRVRGREISMIFEQPGAYLNPVFPVGDQIAEVIRTHKNLSRRKSKKKTLELLDKVGISSPYRRYRQYPHQLSGGMNQRIMIAMALAFKPSLLIADEPTTSLDLTVQAQIIELLHQLVHEMGTTFLLITHDYEVAAKLCDYAAVMYAGRIMETGTVSEVFEKPRHPYTHAMMTALDGNEPMPIPGKTPSLSQLPEGCRFHPRCTSYLNRCSIEEPIFRDGVRCHLH